MKLNDNTIVLESTSVEYTEKIGSLIGSLLKPGQILALNGDLGAGKTSLIRGLAKGMSVLTSETVNSPTYVVLQSYAGEKFSLHHADVYRLNEAEEFLDLDLFDLAKEGVLVIEWADKFEDYLPSSTLKLNLSHLSEFSRSIEFSSEDLYFMKSMEERLILI